MISLILLSVTVAPKLTACQKAVQDVGGDAAAPGAYVPQCDEDGEYKPLQYCRSTGYSWCVTSDGTVIPGTKTPPGKPAPNCSTVTGT